MKLLLKKLLLVFFGFGICLLCRSDDGDGGNDSDDGDISDDSIDTDDSVIESDDSNADIGDIVESDVEDVGLDVVETDIEEITLDVIETEESTLSVAENAPGSGVVLSQAEAETINWETTSNTEEELAILRDMEEKGELDMTAFTVDPSLADPKESTAHLPTEKTGTFSGDRGNSEFTPNNTEALEKMAEYGKTSVTYENGEPNFGPFATQDTPWGKLDTTVEIGHMTQHRENPSLETGRRPNGTSHDPNYELGNFAQADNALLEKVQATHPDVTMQDLRDYIDKSDLTWHETKDGKTMQLVPTSIHDACRHSGGVSQAKEAAQWSDVRRND